MNSLDLRSWNEQITDLTMALDRTSLNDAVYF